MRKSSLSPFSVRNPVVKYSLDLNGDGVTDLECSSLPTITASFQNTGLYLPSVTIMDSQGNMFTDSTIVNVLDKDNLSYIFKVIWKRMTAKLMAGDVDGAMTDHLESVKDKYREISAQFNIDQTNAIFSNITDLEFYSLYDEIASCGALRLEDGKIYSYPVYYARDQYGVWKLVEY